MVEVRSGDLGGGGDGPRTGSGNDLVQVKAGTIEGQRGDEWKDGEGGET